MPTEIDCETALDQYEQQLSRLKNVVGLGVAEQIAQQLGGSRGNPVVTVYVSRKVPESQLAPEDLVPRTLEIKRGKETIQVPTQVVEQGRVELESSGDEVFSTEPL